MRQIPKCESKTRLEDERPPENCALALTPPTSASKDIGRSRAAEKNSDKSELRNLAQRASARTLPPNALADASARALEASAAFSRTRARSPPAAAARRPDQRASGDSASVGQLAARVLSLFAPLSSSPQMRSSPLFVAVVVVGAAAAAVASTATATAAAPTSADVGGDDGLSRRLDRKAIGERLSPALASVKRQCE